MALVAWWPLQGNADDASSNGFHGTAAANVWFRGQQCAQFPGEATANQNAITVPDHPAFNLQQFTVFLRVYLFRDNTNEFFFEKGTVNTQYAAFGEGANLVFRTKPVAVAFHSLTVPRVQAGLVPEVWTTVAATYDGAHKRLYCRGVEVAAAAYSETLATNPAGIILGRYNSSTMAYLLEGRLADVRLYDTALSAGEIADLEHAIELPDLLELAEAMPVSPVVRLTRQRQRWLRRYDTRQPRMMALDAARARLPGYRIYGEALDALEVPAVRKVFALREDGTQIAMQFSQRGTGTWDFQNLPPVPHTIVGIGEPQRNGVVWAHVTPSLYHPDDPDPDPGLDYGLRDGGDDNEGGEGGGEEGGG